MPTLLNRASKPYQGQFPFFEIKTQVRRKELGCRGAPFPIVFVGEAFEKLSYYLTCCPKLQSFKQAVVIGTFILKPSIGIVVKQAKPSPSTESRRAVHSISAELGFGLTSNLGR